MLLALDVGNTNTVLGLYRLDREKPELAAHWRVTTHRAQTVDEYGVFFVNLFEMNGISPGQVTHIIIASVVPPVDSTLRQVCEKYFHIEPLFVEPGIKTGMPMLIDNPTELGADRLADCIGAYDRYGGPCVVVDFGTATKFEVISARGEYLGGAIAPGLGLSAEALFSRAAKLSRVDIRRPAKVIGTNTVTHLQSGLYYGYIGLVDGILERILAELNEAEPGQQPRIVATGGLARMIAGDSRYIKEIDELLTIDGLSILFERNRAARPRGRSHENKAGAEASRSQSGPVDATDRGRRS
ncbi:MAG: type III pantothenate kinase [Acidobacteriota bacterium]|jgi:type III pantothenate kinase